MEIERLREFLLLSQTMNITKAAQELHIAQSALSNHIIKMEKELRVTLIDRSGTKIRFTVEGYQFLECASKMIDIYDEFVFEHHNREQTKSNHFVVQTLQHANRATSVILMRIMEFKKLYPEVQIEIRESLAYDSPENIRKGLIDCGYLGIRLKVPQLEDGTVAIPILDEELTVWLDKTSPLYSAETLAPRDLESCCLPTWVGIGPNGLESLYREIIEEYNVKIKVALRYCISREDYYLNKVYRNDALILTKGSEAIHSISVREDRGLRTFNPPIFARTYAVFRESDENSALSRFQRYLEEKYAVEPQPRIILGDSSYYVSNDPG